MPGWMKWAIALLVGVGIITAGWRLADSRWLFWVLPAFFVANCLVLIVVVLLQSGKAADLAGAFGGAGSQTAFGPRGAATFLSKATTWCAIMFMATSITLGLRTTLGAPSGGSVLQQFSKPATKQQPTTPAPPQQPAQQPSAPPQQPPPSQAPPSQPPAKK